MQRYDVHTSLYGEYIRMIEDNEGDFVYWDEVEPRLKELQDRINELETEFQHKLEHIENLEQEMRELDQQREEEYETGYDSGYDDGYGVGYSEGSYTEE